MLKARAPDDASNGEEDPQPHGIGLGLISLYGKLTHDLAHRYVGGLGALDAISQMSARIDEMVGLPATFRTDFSKVASSLVTGMLGPSATLADWGTYQDTFKGLIGSPALSMGLSPTTLDKFARGSIGPLSAALSAFNDAVRSATFSGPISAWGEPLRTTDIQSSLNAAGDALLGVDTAIVREEHPALAEFIEHMTEQFRIVREAQQESAERLDSMAKDSRAQERRSTMFTILSILLTLYFGFFQNATDDGAESTSVAPSHGLVSVQRDSEGLDNRVAVHSAPMRIKPHGKADLVCRLEERSAVSVLSKSSDWYLVRIVGPLGPNVLKAGWVHRNHLRVP